MANLISENIRKLLSKYAFKMDVESINEDLTCIICGTLMVNAYQSHCDCKYCRECIIRYLDNGNTHCRGGKDECQEEQLVLDKNVVLNIVLNKKVLRARVHCPNKSCEFISKITEMEDHLRLCSQQPADCPYTTIGCGIEGGSRDTVETHIHKESLVHSELLMEVINNLRNEVAGLREALRLNQNEIDVLKEKDVLGRAEMEKKLGPAEREELVELIGEQRSEIIELKKKVESVEDDLKKRDVARTAEVERLGALCGEVEAERAVSTKTRGEVETLREEVKRVGASNVRLEAENPKTRRKIIEMRVLKVGDVVRVSGSLEKCTLLQVDHGGLSRAMVKLLGKVGKVESIRPDGDIEVTVGSMTFTYNPLLLTLVADTRG